MGFISQIDLEDWNRRQRADYTVRQRLTIIKLPCCRSAIEIDPGDGSDQYVSCLNKNCPKLTADGPARHLIAWSLRKTTVRSEAPKLEL